MKEKRTSVFENGLIWFGAAVSIAEIMTGTYFAPLGFKKGMLAILLGHIIGCIMLFLAGVIGGATRKTSMETVKSSFGSRGALFFAVVNIIQLVGWTAIMIYDGALAANGIFDVQSRIWCLVTGSLIILWLMIGIKNLSVVNSVAMSALFILTVILCFVIFRKEQIKNIYGDVISFGAAVELSVAMPLSWLPLISDYTSEAEKPVKATAVSSVVYGVVSCFMYIIGMGAAMVTSESDIAQIMMKAGLGIAGLVIIVFSTVTTTFLDAYSAGISGEAISKKVNGKWLAIIVTVIGTVSAMFFPITDITEFLYFIGSVFAPMIAVQIADYYILKNNQSTQKINFKNICIWFVGFVIYRILMNTDIAVGSTLPDIAITIIICVVFDLICKLRTKRKTDNPDTRLYFITDSSDYSEEEFLFRVEEAIKGGVTLLQLREKEKTTREYTELAKKVHAITKKYNIPLIIDDRVDVALAVDAEGVHVGQSDMPVSVARKLMGNKKIVGATTKTVPQAIEACEQGADYLGVGAIYPTTTKVKTVLTSVDTLKAICESVPIPVNAIGGLNKDNIDVLKGIPVAGICVVSAIMKSDNPRQAADALKEKSKELGLW